MQNWRDAAPRRVIPGTSFSEGFPPGGRVAHEELRKAFTKDGFKVMGEIGLQYEGLSPSDASVDAYFALAEELDVPVAIHMGTGGSGRANVAMPKFRGSMGNPLLLEDLLARHPKLRVQVMHAGYPMIDNMLTLLQASSHVYVDVAGIIWSYPLKEVKRYIEGDREAPENQFDFRSRLKTWAYRVAVNYVLDVRKSAIERLHLSFERFAEDLESGVQPAAPDDTERSMVIEEVKVACTQS